MYIRLKAFKPGKFLERLTGLYRPFHNIYWFLAGVLFILLGIALLLANSDFFIARLYDIFSFGSLIGIVLALFILVTTHEYAHAVVCRYHGGEVRSMGFLLLYFQPCFYTDLSDAWLFENKKHRLAVTAAGPFFQLLLLAAAVMLWRITVVGSLINQIARILSITSWITFLVNMNPLIKLDAYYLLSDWLDIPNLRQKSFEYVGNLFQRRILGWPEAVFATTPRERHIFLSYALLAGAYSIALLSFVFIVAGNFLSGLLGSFAWVLLFGVLFITLSGTIGSLGRGTLHHLKHMKSLFKQPLRLTMHVVVVIGVVVLVFAVPFPHRVSGDVAVRAIQSFTLQVTQLGFLEKRWHRGGANPENKSSFVQLSTTDMAALDLISLVKDGQPVDSGDTVAVLASNQVSSEIVGASSELTRLKGELALLKSPPKPEKVAEAQAEITAARAKLERLQREERRIQALMDRDLVTAQQLDSIKSEVEIAQAEVANKEAGLKLLQAPPKPEEEQILIAQIDRQDARLQFLKEQADAQSVASPINGVASTLQSGGRVLAVHDRSHVELLVPVSDFDIKKIHVGQVTLLKVRSYPGRVFVGRVVHIPEEASMINGKPRYLVSADFVNDSLLLYEGMTGYAKIDIGNASLARLALHKLESVVRVEFWSWW